LRFSASHMAAYLLAAFIMNTTHAFGQIPDNVSRQAVLDNPTAQEQTSPPACRTNEAESLRLLAEAIHIAKHHGGMQAERIAGSICDPDARSVARWAAIRLSPKPLAFAQVQSFLNDHADWPRPETFQARAEEALYLEHAKPETIRGFFTGRAPVTGLGRFILAQAHLQAAETHKAHDLIRHVWRHDHLSPVLETRILKVFGTALTTLDHRDRMERYLFRDNAARALAAAALAGPEYQALAKARLAVAHRAGNAKALLDAVPDSLRKDSAYAYALAQFHRRAERPLEAHAALKNATQDPDRLMDGDEWWVERRLIARQLLDRGEALKAYEVASFTGASSRASRIEAAFHAGWIALRFLNDADRAKPHFNQVQAVAETAAERARGFYWQARLAGHKQDGDARRHLLAQAAGFTTTFYGQQAALELGLDIADAGDMLTTASTRRDDVDPALMRRIDWLSRAGQNDLALALLRDAASHVVNESAFAHLARHALRDHGVKALLQVSRAAQRRGYGLEPLLYPLLGVPIIAPQGQNGVIDRTILLAVARQESAFEPKAVSSAGARGLMQLMPATARETARRFALPFDMGRLTQDPAYNARLGAAHLSELHSAWRGSHSLIFAAYNAGPGHVKDWIARYGDPRDPAIDPIDWIERIPFTETRHYVQQVTSNLLVYRRRLAEERDMADQPRDLVTRQALAMGL
jgi:soluble lytic murein transglycosylase